MTELSQHIPIRQKRPSRPRRNVSLRPETHDKLAAVAKKLNVSLADAVETLIRYAEEAQDT